MDKTKVFLNLGLAGVYVGIGLMAGQSLSGPTTNTALWIGIILILAGSVALGISIGSRNSTASQRHSVKKAPASDEEI